MNKRIIVFILLFLYTSSSYSQKSTDSFNQVSYDGAVIYLLDTSRCKSSKYGVVCDDTLTNCYVKFCKINKCKQKRIMKIINNPSTYGNPPASCSTKDIGIVFYKKDTISKYISMSLSCSSLISSHPIDANEKYKINSGEEGHYIYSTFSIIGKKKLIAFFKGIGLSLSDEQKELPCN